MVIGFKEEGLERAPFTFLGFSFPFLIPVKGAWHEDTVGWEEAERTTNHSTRQSL